MNSKKRLLVTGASGFLGSHLKRHLEGVANYETYYVSSKDYDLLDPAQADQMFRDIKPHKLIHLAAYSGGIGANKKYPADFFYKNSMFVSNIFDLAKKYSIEKMIYTMGGCSYPSDATSPISESQMWKGYPQQESAGYSVAKKMGITASISYRAQYGLNSVVLVPGNLYGEFDNFRLDESHVIPAMIRRYFESQLQKCSEIIMWGDGSPVRDFVYAGDVAKNIIWFLDNYNSSEPVNISSGKSTNIKYLAELIKEKIGHQGLISWDIDKPNGQLVKIFDNSKMKTLGLDCPTSLEDGLQKTIDWFKECYHSKNEGIRL